MKFTDRVEPFEPVPSRLNSFQQQRDPLAAADTSAADAVARVSSPKLEEQSGRESGPRCAERMADGDRPAVDVCFISIEAELFLNGEILAGERFVDLEKINLIERKSGALQRDLDGANRSNAHHRRCAAGDAPRDNPCQGFESALRRALSRGQHHRGGAVRNSAGVAGGDNAVVLKNRLQCREFPGTVYSNRVFSIYGVGNLFSLRDE